MESAFLFTHDIVISTGAKRNGETCFYVLPIFGGKRSRSARYPTLCDETAKDGPPESVLRTKL